MQISHWMRRALVLPACLLLAAAAQAGAPQQKTQAPGDYRMMLGDFEITALSDGTVDLKPKELLTHTTQAQVADLLQRSFANDVVPTSVNACLINTGDKLVLVDTGAAKLFGPTLGNLLANLVAAGYKPEQVDAVLITHMHPDHVGGLMVDGKPAFANATVHADQADADFWLSTSPQGQKLVLWGDLMHVAAVQFPAPQVTIAFDVDSAAAAAQRIEAYADAAQGRYLVAGAHLPFPGIGRIRADGKGYAWVPVDYNVIR